MKNVVDTIENMKIKNIGSSLEKEFRESMKDNNFKLIIDKLKLPKEKVLKYRSTLEECSKNYSRCLECKNILECPYEISGYAYLPKVVDHNLFFSYQPCKYRKKLDEKNKYLKNIYLFDIPREIKEASIDKIYMKDKNRYDVIEWIHRFINNYDDNLNLKGLYLSGTFGCGKTYLIAAMFNELGKIGVKSAIVYWPEYLRELKSSFDTDFKSKFEAIKKVKLLLIDDIGAETTTSWGRDEILGSILQYRMQEKLPTFFTSNLDISALKQHLANSKEGVEAIKAERIIERINQLTDNKVMISKNLRK